MTCTKEKRGKGIFKKLHKFQEIVLLTLPPRGSNLNPEDPEKVTSHARRKFKFQKEPRAAISLEILHSVDGVHLNQECFEEEKEAAETSLVVTHRLKNILPATSHKEVTETTSEKCLVVPQKAGKDPGTGCSPLPSSRRMDQSPERTTSNF